ncbi:MAG: hypothetical protein KGD60_08820 [Candidatus Thorarchaeota archaeon]|nr:hypothetical protein [Candidatus Thorarchaeota archaeon]
MVVDSLDSDVRYITGVTGLVSKTVSLYSRRVGVYVAIVGFLQLILGFIVDLVFFSQQPLIRPLSSAAMGIDLFSLLTSSLNLIGFPNSFIMFYLGLSIAGIVIMALFGGAAIKYALDNYEDPLKGNPRESLPFATSRASALITTQLVITSMILLIVSPVLIALLYEVVMLYPISPYAYIDVIMTSMPVLLTCLVLVIYVSVRLAPTSVIIIAEDLSAYDSLKRAWVLTSGKFWHTFGGIFLLMMILGPIAAALSFLGLVTYFGISVWLTIVPASIIQLFLSPISYVFQTVLYKDLISRKGLQAGSWWQ